MLTGAIICFVAAAVLTILGISFAYDIGKGVGPTLQGASVDSRVPLKTYTFLRISGKPVAIFVTVLTFLLAAGALVGGIAMLVA